jgi:hypothetical protein
MKNANVFIDVDLRLVDANRKLLAGARGPGSAERRRLPPVALVYLRGGLLPEDRRPAWIGQFLRGVQRQAGHPHR